ncbi:MAG: hypothetical protein U0802_21980 [Candidatus Binatia bacterium]
MLVTIMPRLLFLRRRQYQVVLMFVGRVTVFTVTSFDQVPLRPLHALDPVAVGRGPGDGEMDAAGDGAIARPAIVGDHLLAGGLDVLAAGVEVRQAERGEQAEDADGDQQLDQRVAVLTPQMPCGSACHLPPTSRPSGNHPAQACKAWTSATESRAALPAGRISRQTLGEKLTKATVWSDRRNPVSHRGR